MQKYIITVNIPETAHNITGQIENLLHMTTGDLLNKCGVVKLDPDAQILLPVDIDAVRTEGYYKGVTACDLFVRKLVELTPAELRQIFGVATLVELFENCQFEELIETYEKNQANKIEVGDVVEYFGNSVLVTHVYNKSAKIDGMGLPKGNAVCGASISHCTKVEDPEAKAQMLDLLANNRQN